ncbi:MAG: peptidyl-prolyl cis-trans isomerase [Candidatus Adiutrix sp.]|jgi:parvulin-like peptidyl-prolyl isomerase|nr:peptidyl-prolyl cis-trans isomerase [Candidatus Adiutrix sp.]
MFKKFLPTLIIIFLTAFGCDGGESPPPPAATPPAPPAGEAEAKAAVVKEAAIPVVATVNGVDISSQLLEGQVSLAEANLMAYGNDESLSDEELAKKDLDLRLEVLNGLVSFELACQEAVRRGYAPDQAEVDETLAALKKGYDEPDMFLKSLEQYGATEDDLRAQMLKTMALKKWQENDFLSDIKVTPEEAKAFYEAHQDMVKHGDLARYSQIFLAVPLVGIVPDKQAQAKTEARAKAETALKRVQAGEDFGAVAVAMSEEPGASETRGDMGWTEAGQGGGFPQFAQALSKLKPGEVSEILESPMGFHLIKLTEVNPAGIEPFEKVNSAIVDYLSGEKLEEALSRKMVALYQSADIKILDPRLKAAYEAFEAAGTDAINKP